MALINHTECDGIKEYLRAFGFLLTVVPLGAAAATVVCPEQVRFQVGQAAAAAALRGDGVHAPHDGLGIRRREGAGEERLLSQPAMAMW